MDNFLISIIIPTRNRQVYLLKCVTEILEINDERIQIVIQDNSDNPGLLEQLPTCEKKDKIKYHYTPGSISFVENFNIAVGASDGIYSCMIGDDDGITEYIGDVTEWAYKNSIEMIKPDILFEYFWPKSINIKGKQHQGLIRLLESDVRASFFNPFIHLKKLLLNGAQDYTSLDVGKLYHGIVKTQKLREIKNHIGKYFGGLSPDIYMTVALSLTIKNAVKISFPLTIAGVCQTSGSADSSSGRHVGTLNSAPHFKGHEEYCWSKEVPQFYSVETIWADSALAALYDFKATELIKLFSVTNLDAHCKMKYPEYADIIKIHYRQYQISCDPFKKNISGFKFKIYPALYLSRKVLRRIWRFNKKLHYIDNIPDIMVANAYFKRRCIENKLTKKGLISILDKMCKEEENV